MEVDERCGWMAVGLVSVTGCLGYPNALTSSSTTEASTTEVSTTEVSTTETSTTETSTTTGPIAECGNDEVEGVEECDGTDLNGATCGSLGFSETGLACVGCQLDVSECWSPPGMVEVPGGTFEMGSNDYEEEQPIRQVQVDTFWIDQTEVTVDAYAACVDDDGACSEPATGEPCNWMVAGRENHPVNCVTWDQAEMYCGWAEGGTKRLPTEAEWEKAARGTCGCTYPWGDSPDPSCTHVVMSDAEAGGDGCGTDSTMSVGSKPYGVSPYGAHDMAGNVWEWVADWYAYSYDAAETDNPTGPAGGTWRVARGGSFYNEDLAVFRASFRSSFDPSGGYSDVGFRCVRTPLAAL